MRVDGLGRLQLINHNIYREVPQNIAVRICRDKEDQKRSFKFGDYHKSSEHARALLTVIAVVGMIILPTCHSANRI